jgi:general secretion pathway protein G
MRAKGFTLIELLVVFALIALLLTIAVPRFMGSAETAKVKVQAQNIATLRDAIDKFRADQGGYPNELGDLVQRGYLRALPIDPVSGTSGWIAVASPAGEAGVYDVAAPAVPTAAAAAASSAQ